MPIGRIPKAAARRMISRAIGPMPSTPIVRPSRSSNGRGSQTWAAWSRSTPRMSRLSAEQVQHHGAGDRCGGRARRGRDAHAAVAELAEDRVVGAGRERVQPAQLRRIEARGEQRRGARRVGVGREEERLDPGEVGRIDRTVADEADEVEVRGGGGEAVGVVLGEPVGAEQRRPAGHDEDSCLAASPASPISTRSRRSFFTRRDPTAAMRGCSGSSRPPGRSDPEHPCVDLFVRSVQVSA